MTIGKVASKFRERLPQVVDVASWLPLFSLSKKTESDTLIFDRRYVSGSRKAEILG